MKKNILTARDGKFFLDGEEFVIRSGAIHYFRIPDRYWRERLSQLVSCGFNTVETYMPWNLHEKRKGEFDFSGILDISGFIKTADELGLYVIVRPGPYICAEWDFGGLPAWLLADDNIRLRCLSEPYFTHVSSYLEKVFSVLSPHLSENGGNVIAMQVENEYGSYGNDHEYIKALADLYRKNGSGDTFLFTSDGPCAQMFSGGTNENIHAVANFGSNAKGNLDALASLRPGSPLMCGEYWDGWFDHWGEVHHGRDAKTVVSDIDEMLAQNASFNIYMFNGGTNFGFMNGANSSGAVNKEKYQPTVTSYDYDCIINEWGGYTDKYRLLRALMEKHLGKELPSPPEEPKRRGYGRMRFECAESFITSFEKYSKHFRSAFPEAMEKYGQNYGLIAYKTHIDGPVTNSSLVIPAVGDMAYIYADGTFVGSIFRNDEERSLLLPDAGKDGYDIVILVSNFGRINYGRLLRDRKGITEGVLLNYQYQFGWDVYTMEFDTLPDVPHVTPDEITNITDAAILKGEFLIDDDTPLCHTFLKTNGFRKGFACVNGFNLGRFNSDGPTKTLFVPASILRHGMNEVFIFEQETLSFADTDEAGYPTAELVRSPEL